MQPLLDALAVHAQNAPDKVAVVVDASGGGTASTTTFGELNAQINRLGNGLVAAGARSGERLVWCGPNSLEVITTIHAARKCNLVAVPLSYRFNAEEMQYVIDNSDATVVVIDAEEAPLVASVRDQLPKLRTVVVFGGEVPAGSGFLSWDEVCADQPTSEPDVAATSEAGAAMIYTSGTTGKPKGLVHTTGGYSVQSYLTSKYVFDLREEDVFWCTADIGWVTGHSYVVYGPLQNGATVMMYEGAPNWPECDRFWKIVDDHKVTIFYTAPTAIRAFIKWGDSWVRKHSLESLRLLGTVGEPINPESWMWYHRMIGKERCPIVDTYWQTETGTIMISPLPGAVATKPGSATLPFFGIVPEVVTKEGKPVPDGQGGLLVFRTPWPSMARTIYGDQARYEEAYWSEVPGSYFTGDGARRDSDGYFWLMGRVDDVINVSGHRLGTMEVESALVAHPKVAEAAVVGRPHEMKGQAIAAFVTLEGGHVASEELRQELRQWVAKEIGALARPDDLRFTDALPKTRSGKIMRRLLRELATTGEVKGDTTTLEDFAVIAKLREGEE
jgi:acetyl-CoA synthetase